MYCTTEDIKAEFTQIMGWAEDAQIEHAIKLVSADIDGYLASGGYDLPLAGNPLVLEQRCADMVAWKLLSAKGVLPPDLDGGTEPIRARHKDAVRWLEQIAKGTLTLGITKKQDGEVERSRGGMRTSGSNKLDLGGFV